MPMWDDDRDGEETIEDTFTPDTISCEEEEKPYRRHPAVKYIAAVLLLAFIAFAFPQLQMIWKNPYDFLENKKSRF